MRCTGPTVMYGLLVHFLTQAILFLSTTIALQKKLPSNAETGTWKIVVDFRGQVEAHYFTVGCTANYNLTSETGSYGYIASNAIESSTTATSGNKVLLQAANNITLKPGFHAVSGTTFKARIRDCNFSE